MRTFTLLSQQLQIRENQQAPLLSRELAQAALHRLRSQPSLQQPRAALNSLHPQLPPTVNGLWIAPVLDSMVATAKYLVPNSHHLQHLVSKRRLRLRLLKLIQAVLNSLR